MAKVLFIKRLLNRIKRLLDQNLLPGFIEYEKLIMGIAAIAGVLVLLLTVYQISETKRQIRAQFSYQLHKDGRSIGATIDDNVRKYIWGKIRPQEVTKELEERARRKISELLRYYAAAYHQRRFGNIDPSEWNIIYKEFCGFLKAAAAKSYWEKRISVNKAWSARFRTKGNECFTQVGSKR